MITGKIRTETFPGGGQRHTGTVAVTNETVGPLDVLASQIPDVRKGNRRVRSSYITSADGTAVDVLIDDEPAGG